MANLNISVSPHIKSKTTTHIIMRDVIIALLPAAVASVILFGVTALYKISLCIVTCVLSEFIFELIVKRPITIGDLSAVVTGLILALNLPVDIPEWQLLIGCIFAIVVVKQLFGGLGCNFANPAIAGRVMMLLAFTEPMTNFTKYLVSGATPLAQIAEGKVSELPSLLDMFLGKRGGSMGETCAIALLIGFIYLICRKVITWHTPVIYVATVFVLAFFVNGCDASIALYEVLSGGLLLGAIFMATDYVTSPPNPLGKVIFAIGCGIITFAIRQFGSYPEGVSFSILFMNILNPYICMLTAHRPLGALKDKA